MSNVRNPKADESATNPRPRSLRASFFVIPSTFVIRHSTLPRRRGLTLLEVILALALSSLVLATLAAAMHFHLRVVGRRQQDIEEAQLARALLRQISDDVRGAVLYNPPDTSALMSLAGAGSPSSGSGGGGGGGSIVVTSDGETTTTYADEETQSVAPPTIPGLRGGPDWLQVDVSRMPRRDQYDLSLQGAGVTGPADQLSDVKTVTYFVETPPSGTTSSSDVATGLMRVELARAVTSWANQNATLDLSGGEPIAPEVTQIAFRYHDGVEANGWVEEWDSEERGALPVAIEIALRIVSLKPQRSSGLSGSTAAAAAEEEAQIYRLVVHLPDRRAGDVPEDIDTGGEEVQP